MGTGVPKQYLNLAGRPLLLHTLERLCTYPRIRGVHLGISSKDTRWPSLAPHCLHLPHFAGSYIGGARRADTVLAGLHALSGHAQDDDWVLVHDVVRPCVRHADIDRLMAAVEDGVEGGLLALPLTDTVKRTDALGNVVETVTRMGLWRALTPQVFRLSRLRKALEVAVASGEEITDEAAAIERAGGRPRVVAGNPDNIKITLPGDLALAELFLKRQQDSPH